MNQLNAQALLPEKWYLHLRLQLNYCSFIPKAMIAKRPELERKFCHMPSCGPQVGF